MSDGDEGTIRGAPAEAPGEATREGRAGRPGKRGRQQAAPRSEHYDDIIRANDLFEQYYKRQEIVPEDEWEEFVQCLGSSLPTTFRITGHRDEAASVRNHIQEFIVPTLAESAPRPLAWYEPKGLAWHLDGGRKDIRTSENFAALHKWLVAATENGDISRQEAVSMIPPLLLDVQAHHRVLDLCAAPGSKTAQLIEYMHGHALATNVCPSGLVVANDADQQRAYMLYHQVKRILSPSLLVTNNDGTSFPTLVQRSSSGGEGGVERVYFDRILADVPCSGDGTLRKNAMLWKTWTPNHALGLHPLQVRLLDKALRLLKVGGRLVYSTCSMNFVENEAVVAHLLALYPHALELVDVSGELPELIRRPGKATWRVFSKEGVEYEGPESVPAELKKRFPPSLFPKETYAGLALERCMRIYPHLQNTGGFFVAVIDKKAQIHVSQERADDNLGRTGETGAGEVRPPRPNFKKGSTGYRVAAKAEGEFRMLDPSTDPVLQQIFAWYGIDQAHIVQEGYGFLVRSDRNPVKTISIISPTAHLMFAVTVPPHREGDDGSSRGPQDLYNGTLKMVNVGVRAFDIYESSRPVPVACAYRPLTESVAVLRPLMTKRVLAVSTQDLVNLLESLDSVVLPAAHTLGQGGAILETATLYGSMLSIPVWISEKGVKAFVPKKNRPALLLQIKK